jgi:hypothetical protein
MSDVLDCFTTDSAKRKFIKEPGLFKQGIKLVETLHLSPEEQLDEIDKLPGVKKYNPNSKEYDVDLGWAGKYHVTLGSTPRAYRIESKMKTHNNPFLGSNGGICLGTASELYNRCYYSDNMVDCVKITNAILSCESDSSGYRRWSSSTLAKKRLSR